MKNLVNKEDRSELLGQVIDVFEDFLCEKNINIFNPSGDANIYGNDYDHMRQKLNEALVNWGLLEDDRPLAEYLFEVSINDQKCNGTISIMAADPDSAYQKAQDQVAEGLYKAFPSLDISYDIEQVEEEGYPRYRIEVLHNSFDSSCSVSETSNLQAANEYYEAKTKEENHSVLMRTKTCEGAKWCVIKEHISNRL